MSDLQNTWIPTPPPTMPIQDNNSTWNTWDNSNTWDDKKDWEEEEVIVPIWEFWVSNDFHTRISLPEHDTNVDEELFLWLLVWSISLSIEEKKKIVENFWSLNQFQVDELIKIFEEEKAKFSALDVKHKEQLDKLQKQHLQAWDAYELNNQQEEESEIEEDEADDIRKSLGL